MKQKEIGYTDLLLRQVDRKISDFSEVISKINPNLKWRMIIITRQKKHIGLKKENIDIILSKEKVVDWTRPEIDWKKIFRN